MEKLPIEVLESAIDTQKRFIPLYEKKFGGNPTFDISLLLLLEELKHYRELQEQGRLLELPCNVGDTVYHFCGEFGQILEYEVDYIIIAETVMFQADAYSKNIGEDSGELLDTLEENIDEIGKTVFLTKTEAEQAIAERQA